MYDTAAEAMGKVFVTTELGGGGTSAPHRRIARRGVHNFLAHAGILAGEVEPSDTGWLDMPSDDCFTFPRMTACIEPLVDLGEPGASAASRSRGLPDRPHRGAGRLPRGHGRHPRRPAFPGPGQGRRLHGGVRRPPLTSGGVGFTTGSDPPPSS